MSPILNITIPLNIISKDYLRAAILLHVIAFVILVRSDLPIIVIVPLASLLIPCLINIIYHKVPLPTYCKLTYQSGHWWLQDKQGHEKKYIKANITFHGGFYILLRLKGESIKKELIIFKDQLTNEQYRQLELMRFFSNK